MAQHPRTRPLDLLIAGVLGAAPLAAQSTIRVSVDSAGAQGLSPSWGAALSGDGTVTAFHSFSVSLVPGDGNGSADIFVHDRWTGETSRVSIATSGLEANFDSFDPTLSADGRFVAFHSLADNLVPNDSNRRQDAFVHDRATGTTSRVSLTSGGAEADGDSSDAVISADGRHVAFWSSATNLVAGDTNGDWDVFLHDRLTGTTERISVSTSGAGANAHSRGPAISGDGRFVAFESEADNLVPGDTNGAYDVFVRDRLTGRTARVSVGLAGVEANRASIEAALSEDGRWVAFRSDATNLVAGDTNGRPDVFVHELATGTTERISLSTSGAEGDGASTAPALSADGGVVAFASAASNLAPPDTNGAFDVLVHDRATGVTTRESVSSAGRQGGFGSYDPTLSADGRLLSFDSDAAEHVPGDTNDRYDAFVRNRTGPALVRTGSCPGAHTLLASGATAAGRVAFVWGRPGSFVVPGGLPCAGQVLDLRPIGTPPPGYTLATADLETVARVTSVLPPGACGTLLVQAVDLTSCATTNTLPL